MTDTTPAAGEDQISSRRAWLRGGAALAGAAALAAAVPNEAHAATGDPLVAGRSVDASAGTSLTANISDATLTLGNDSGPTLHLSTSAAIPTSGAVGDIYNSDLGPYAVIDDGAATYPSGLMTRNDLDFLPIWTVAFEPVRVMDSRLASFRSEIVGASQASPFDSRGRLKAKTWIDVGLYPVGDRDQVVSAFLNLTVTGSSSKGSVTVYPPSAERKPAASTLTHAAGWTIANTVFVAVSELNGAYAVRVYTRTTTHVILDWNGAVVASYSPSSEVGAASTKAGKKRYASRHKAFSPRR